MGGGSSIFLPALGERRDVYSASFARVGWGRVFNPFPLNAVCKVSFQR